MRKLILVLAVAAAATLAGGASANTNLGGATSNADGTVTLNSSATPFSAGVDVSLPGVTFVGDISAFSVDYNFPNGCPTGVPILAIVTVRGTIWTSIGSAGGFTCAPGTHNAYVLTNTTPTDTHEIVGGTVSDNWGRAHSEYDNLRVLAVQLLTTGANQVVTVGNINLVIGSGAPTASM
jgi:hypothetical protein